MSNISIVQTEDTKQKFVKYYKAVNKIADQETAENLYSVELHFFTSLLQATAALLQCTKESIANIFLEVIGSGLSFDPAKKHIYLMSRNVKVADNQWEKRLQVDYTFNAEIKRRVDAGSIKDCTVAIVYDGDDIKVGAENGVAHVSHGMKIPRGNKIIGGIVYVNHTNGSVQPHWFDIADMGRLAKASARQNSYYKDGKKVSGKPNALYSSDDGQIDAGFFKTKIVQQALKYYPTTASKYNPQSSIDPDFDDVPQTNGELKEAPAQETAQASPPVGDHTEDLGFD